VFSFFLTFFSLTLSRKIFFVVDMVIHHVRLDLTFAQSACDAVFAGVDYFVILIFCVFWAWCLIVWILWLRRRLRALFFGLAWSATWGIKWIGWGTAFFWWFGFVTRGYWLVTFHNLVFSIDLSSFHRALVDLLWFVLVDAKLSLSVTNLLVKVDKIPYFVFLSVC
jgi:hypothetical protein